MSDRPFRFLHASDLRIDEPLFGLSEASAPLIDVLIDAPYAAAEQVFETAILEQVSAVVLSGGVLDLRSPTPRGLLFLREQFHHLAEHGISVFWAGNHRDRGDLWPTAIELPPEVLQFGTSLKQAIATDADEPLFAVCGCSLRRSAEINVKAFERSPDGLFTVAIVAGRAEPQLLATRDLDYWALGGQSQRQTVLNEPHVAHYPGTSQGRHRADIGPHGCTLVDVSADRQVRTRFIPCDAARWHHERVTVPDNLPLDRVETVLADRVQDLRSRSAEKPMLIAWTLVVEDESVKTTDLSRALVPIAERMNRRYGNPSQRCWTVSVDADTRSQIPAEWYDENTLLGDYLRTIRELHEDRESPLLGTEVDLLEDDAKLHSAAKVSNSDERSRLLRQASVLGASLLRGDPLQKALDRAMAGEPTDWK